MIAPVLMICDERFVLSKHDIHILHVVQQRGRFVEDETTAKRAGLARNKLEEAGLLVSTLELTINAFIADPHKRTAKTFTNGNDVRSLCYRITPKGIRALEAWAEASKRS